MLMLYKGLVRPQLEYCVQAWRPYLQKDIDLIEAVQKRFTKLIPDLKKMSYEERLRALKLTTLEVRRERGDLIEVYKIIKGIDKVGCLQVENKKSYGLRGHNYKLVKKRFNLKVGQCCFSNRVVNQWNSLPNFVVNSENLNAFKRNLDQYWS